MFLSYEYKLSLNYIMFCSILLISIIATNHISKSKKHEI